MPQVITIGIDRDPLNGNVSLNRADLQTNTDFFYVKMGSGDRFKISKIRLRKVEYNIKTGDITIEAQLVDGGRTTITKSGQLFNSLADVKTALRGRLNTDVDKQGSDLGDFGDGN